MTATRDRQSDLDEEPAEPAWDERPIVGNARGLSWWAAVLLAFGLAAIAAWFDMQQRGSLGRIYQGAYILGCIGAVCWVRRRNLFGPMVQPPLVFAVTAIGGVVLSQDGAPFSGGLKQLIFSVALPLTSNFPTMAITTGVTVAVGLLRLVLQRNPAPRIRSSRTPRDRDPLDALEGRSGRAPRSRRPREEQLPDRAVGQRSGGRTRAGQDQPPAAGTRQRRSADRLDRPGRTDPRDQPPPPRRGRGRSEPPVGTDRARTERGRSEPAPRRQADRGDQPPRRSGDPRADQPRRPLRRRPPDGS